MDAFRLEVHALGTASRGAGRRHGDGPGRPGRPGVSRVADHVLRVRSKNAGPFRLTIDLFCRDDTAYRTLAAGLPTARVANAFDLDESLVERHELPTLDVIKFSLRRPVVQGSADDRDMHGAQWAVLVAALPVDD